ncbi:Kinesin light chain [Seminavis robusta]|uniref:Kinesin light chain n=1 Tax=Seminavis robusta TaxID=568900 RepID=A0A9N8EVN1_9STRA|nr:Kinesin light chain [Seminavis robusta]|eukprot:Sro2380_g325440.1 Kinesin light chain (454) ;mRNA; r:7345-9058
MSSSMFTTSTPTATEVVGSFNAGRTGPPNGSGSFDGSNDEALASFTPEFSLMENRSLNDDNHSIGLTSSADRFNRGTIGSSPTKKTCMPGGFFWRSKASRKVMSQDVASVGGASEAMISVSSKLRMSGRDLHEAAKASLNAGEYAKSLSFFDSLREAQVQRFGHMHPSVGAAIHNVAVVHLRMGNNEKAEKLFAEAVAIRKETLSSDSLEVAASLSKLGSTRVALKKFDEALSDLREATRIARYKAGTNSKLGAQTLCNMAYLYFQSGELLAAEATFRDALDIYRAVWSSDADRDSCMAQLTDCLCNIGSIENKRKRYSQAISSFNEALDLQRGVMGSDHPRVIATLDNLAFSYSKNRDYTAALSCYKEMQAAQVSHYNIFSEACCETLRKQNLMYEKLKNLNGAMETTQEALLLQKTMLPPDSPVVIQTKEMLESIQKKMGRQSSSRNLRHI